MKDKDTQLINRTLEGDDNAFAELVEKHKKEVHALVWRKIGDFHIAEEITQDTFLQAYQNLATLKQTQSFSSWLHVIALRCCNMWFRKKYRRTQLMQNKDTHNPEEATYSSYVHEENQRFSIEAQREVVKKLLAKLEESERTVMTLHYFGDMSCSEIGKFMGVSTNTIKSRLRRARQRLQKEETMIREVLDNFKITPHLTENVMREISRTKPAAPSSSKPLVPWAIAASTLAVGLLMLGFGNSNLLTLLQKPYNFDASTEVAIEMIDTPIVTNLEHKPDVRTQIGSVLTLNKRKSPQQQQNDVPAVLSETQGVEIMEDYTASSSSHTVTIPDASLAAAVRKTLGLGPTDPIPQKELEKLEQLHANENGIRDLTGLEKATGLTVLALNRNRISDLTPLTNLTHLRRLTLYGNNINDITPLTGITKLSVLYLTNNQIRDITPIAELTKMKSLWLDHNRISAISSLDKLTELKELLLNNNQIRDISSVQNLTHLESLFLHGNPIQDVAPLKRLLAQNPELETDISAQRPSSTELDPTIPDVNLADLLRVKLSIEINDPIPIEKLKTLKKLYISKYRNIKELTGLQNATNLEILHIDENKITDLKPLANLTQLTELWLHCKSISDLTPLANLTKLTRLYKNGNQISDISPLTGLTQLETIALIDNQITDITPLKGMPNLRNIVLSKNKITDITPLSELTQLRYINLINNQIDDITPLTGMTELTTLWIGENQIDNLTPLIMLTKLKSLKLGKNNITDIEPLTDLIQLEELNLSRNQIQNIEPLTDLIQLEELDLSRNQIHNVEPLADLTKLQKLRLHRNKITHVESLESMTNLVELNLGGNQISDISPLSGMQYLTKLWLWGNQIKDISPIAEATLLNILHIERNRIIDISSIEKFTRLTDLNIKENSIQDMGPLGELLKVNSDLKLDIRLPAELNLELPPANR